MFIEFCNGNYQQPYNLGSQETFGIQISQVGGFKGFWTIPLVWFGNLACSLSSPTPAFLSFLLVHLLLVLLLLLLQQLLLLLLSHNDGSNCQTPRLQHLSLALPTPYICSLVNEMIRFACKLMPSFVLNTFDDDVNSLVLFWDSFLFGHTIWSLVESTFFPLLLVAFRFHLSFVFFSIYLCMQVHQRWFFFWVG